MSGTVESQKEFSDSPEGWSQRWQMELQAARKALADFYKVGEEADAALRDEKKDNGGKRLCLYASGLQTIGAMLYGRMPQASVGRKFADADDDDARVASEMLERLLNCDIERADDTFAEATRNAMMDWRGPGLGVERHRYDKGEPEMTEEQPAIVDPSGLELSPAVPAIEKRPNEKAETDYVHWRNFLWAQCNVWHETPWVAFKSQLSREKLVERFGEEVGNAVPLNAKRRGEDGKDVDKSHPWDRADVWEFWHKDSKKVFWVVEGYHQTLDIKDDPLGLEGFFPCQRPMMANLTTSKLIPVSDYKFAQDLYRSVDTLTDRIDVLARAVRLAGVYDKGSGSVVEKLVQGGENKLYPVDNWAMFAEKGGLQGAVSYLPLQEIVATLTTLRDVRREDIDLIYQVTGQSDLIRGQQTANGTPGEAKVKAKFGSVRLQAMQDELARFASDGQRIRAEIISRHFDPDTILKRSNIELTPDRQFAQKAVELIKSRLADYRVEIKPEAINLTDFAARKEESMEVLGAIGAYFNVIGPLAQQMPAAMPFFLKMLQVSVARLKGGSAYESLIDQAIAAAEQAAQQPQQQQEDPKMAVERVKLQGLQMKQQSDMAREQLKGQIDLTKIQAEVEADASREQTQAAWNVTEHTRKLMATNALKPKETPNGRPKP